VVIRVLASPRILGALALAIIFAVACVLLGRWQWGRYEERQVRAAAVTAHYSAAPVPLASVPSRLPLREEDEWLRVTTTGRYAGAQLLVRNRTLDSTPGMEVLAPLDLNGALAGERLLVDRGWVPNATSAAELPEVPPTPSGEVTVEGWLRQGEPDLGRDLPAGQLASISVPTAEEQVGGELLDAYLVLDTEQTTEQTASGTPPRPAPLAQPDTDLGPHQAYAFQWWLTSVFGFVLLGYRLRLAVAAQAEAQHGQPVAVRPKKVRIWDEEDA
jgi:cytochrome oxidase assembly protein ShyY1